MSAPKPRGGHSIWYAWDREYPNEGSVVVTADTRERAIEEAREHLDIGPEWIEVEMVGVDKLVAEVLSAVRALRLDRNCSTVPQLAKHLDRITKADITLAKARGE